MVVINDLVHLLQYYPLGCKNGCKKDVKMGVKMLKIGQHFGETRCLLFKLANLFYPAGCR
jgi:hypothetical protein